MRALAQYVDRKRIDYLARFIESSIRPEYLVSLALEDARADSKLARCTPESFYIALLACAQTGLRPGRLLGEAYLVPYGDQVQMLPGWQGLLKLIREAGADAWGAVVYEQDDFSIEQGSASHRITHRPAIADPGPIIGAYACTELRGRVRAEYMRIEELKKARALAGRKSPAWETWPEEMYRKVVLKRATKHLPKGPQLARALSIDNAVATERPHEYRAVIDIEPGIAEPVREDPSVAIDPDAQASELSAAIKDAPDVKTLAHLASQIRDLPGTHRDAVTEIYRLRRAQLLVSE